MVLTNFELDNCTFWTIKLSCFCYGFLRMRCCVAGNLTSTKEAVIQFKIGSYQFFFVCLYQILILHYRPKALHSDLALSITYTGCLVDLGTQKRGNRTTLMASKIKILIFFEKFEAKSLWNSWNFWKKLKNKNFFQWLKKVAQIFFSMVSGLYVL